MATSPPDIFVLRRNRAGNVTKYLTLLESLIVEEDEAQLPEILEKTKSAFLALREAHQGYMMELEESKSIDQEELTVKLEQCESWFEKYQSRYLSGVSSAKNFLKSCAPMTPTSPMSPVSSITERSSMSSEVAALLNLPNMTVDVFTGNPKDYFHFITTFDQVIGNVVSDDQTKLTRLYTYLSEDVQLDVLPAVHEGGSSGYKRAREILESTYGSKNQIVDSIMRDLTCDKAAHTPALLKRLANQLVTAAEDLKKLKAYEHVNRQKFIKSVLVRCPPYMRSKWRDIALKENEKTGEYPTFEDFASFVKRWATRARDPEYGSDEFSVSTKRVSTHSSSMRWETSSNHEVYASSSGESLHCICCEDSHDLTSCSRFKSMSCDDRFNFARTNRLCFGCLSNSHVIGSCNNKQRCNIDGCVKSHSRLLHSSRFKPSVSTASSVHCQKCTCNCDFKSVQAETVSHSSGNSKSVTSNTVSVNQAASRMRVYLPMVTVLVNGHYPCTCLLDTGSTSTLCTPALAEKLHLPTSDIKCDLNTLGSDSTVVTKTVEFTVTAIHDGSVHHLSDVLLVPTMPARVPSGNVCLDDYPFLRNLEFSPLTSTHADIIIGQDHANLIRPLKVYGSDDNRPNMPYAMKTKLGLTLCGPARTLVDAETVSHIRSNVISHHMSATVTDDNIQELWNIEKETNLDENSTWSVEDHYVYDLWERETKLVDGFYFVPIPWRPDKPNFPNNKSIAVKRLHSTIHKLQKSDIYTAYNEEINKLLSEGQAELVPESDLLRNDGAVWYLPHHAVTKKIGKVRMVFDCAALYEGVCLNSECYQGPNLCNSLLDVLLRFRQYEHAIVGDVKTMYLNVRIPILDRDCLRFLWMVDGRLVEYRMSSHLFGAVWCSASSTYALRRTLRDFQASFEVTQVVERSMYVDDLLRSLQDVFHAAFVIVQVYQILRKGGFHLTKFIATDPRMLKGIPVEDLAGDHKIITSESQSKALGIKWLLQPDQFYYVYHSDCIETAWTKRRMLSTVSGLYDPLGLILPVVIVGRMLFQEVTKLDLLWDDIIPESLSQRWDAWRQALASLSDLRFLRPVVPNDADVSTLTLHHFADGSLHAYGAVSYLVGKLASGMVWCSLLMSRARLTPVKSVSVPRIELCAALLASRSDVILREALDLELQTSRFWSDSQVVLGYINSESHRFKVFVANRISQIRSVSHPSQWSFVPSGDNPADVLSRGALPSQLPSMWFQGPSFLYDQCHVVSTPMQSVVSNSDPELKRISCFTCTDDQVHPLDRLMAYYSDLSRLKKAVSWWIKLRDKLLQPTSDITSISVSDLNRAERLLVSHAQESVFTEELLALRSDRIVPVSSCLRQLDPILLGNLIAVGGRLKHAKIHSTAKHPLILPRGHRLTFLILLATHQRAHLGTEWALSTLRAKYWIPGARNMLRHIRRKCVTCQRLYDSPSPQKMADLPPARVESSAVAFQATGLDLFGPFSVLVKRSTVKRWGCVFTCMSMRAIHLEVLSSLETDTFINGFIRFCARRGYPEKIFSDCGTNLVGAQSEMASELLRMDKGKIIRTARQYGVEWSFTTPTASHSAGVWERVIRSVRRVLLAITSSSSMTDEMLSTVFCQVENIVNSRPITKLSMDINDPSPLTPNHLLLLRSSVLPAWNDYQPADTLRRKWKHVQCVSTAFWKRWLRDYLPELQKRSKWISLKSNLKVGDLVLLLDESAPRSRWPLGLIIEVRTGRDGLVRTVRVRFGESTLVRPVTKLVRLELS